MPITIDIQQKHADRLTGLIQQRDAIQQDGQARIDAIIKEVHEKMAAKNELIQGWISIHMAGAGHDPDAPRGNSRIMPAENGTFSLTVEDVPDAPGPRNRRPGAPPMPGFPQPPAEPAALPADDAQKALPFPSQEAVN